MYAARATQLAKTITMACSVQKQPPPTATSTTSPVSTPSLVFMPSNAATGNNNGSKRNINSNCGSSSSLGANSSSVPAVNEAPPLTPKPRNSLPTDVMHPPPLEFQWPPIPVSSHTSNLRLNMMNQNPKDLHTARLMIEELRSKVRYQAEHIMKWRKAYALQIQQHYRYQKEKTDQMNTLTSQLLLLESRLKRKQKQIASLLGHREMTIQRQQKIIDTLSSRLTDHGLDAIEANYTTELDSLNDSDSAVVLEDIDSDSSNMPFGARRRSSGGGGGMGMGGCGISGGDGITIVRSISDAIETNLNKYGGVRRNNCFLRRPEILETVYSVEEDPEPTSDVAEKRDKFRNRSDKALSSSSTEGQIDNNAATTTTATATTTVSIAAAAALEHLQRSAKEKMRMAPHSPQRQLSISQPVESPTCDGYMAYSVLVPQLRTTAATPTHEHAEIATNGTGSNNGEQCTPERAAVKSQVTNYNRVMSNHRSVTKPKDVKYKRINKAKSKSLEELRGRLKNLVERGAPGASMEAAVTGGYGHGVMPQTAQSYA